MIGDVVIWNDADGEHYVGCFDGKYFRWPATADGWRNRRTASENDVDTSRELPSENARLALKLSGVTDGR